MSVNSWAHALKVIEKNQFYITFPSDEKAIASRLAEAAIPMSAFLETHGLQVTTPLHIILDEKRDQPDVKTSMIPHREIRIPIRAPGVLEDGFVEPDPWLYYLFKGLCEQGMYSESPRVTSVSAHTLGATVPATHAVVVEGEYLGQSTGEPGQSFRLEYSPVLSLAEGETIELEETRSGEVVFVPWHQVDDFSQSGRYDRHFVLDAAHGEVSFGPAVRQPDGTVRQYGRVPEPGRSIRISRYRRGGGVIGNLPADSLQVLTTSLAYVSRVTNLRRAAGGRDGETLDELKARAQREMRAQQRAVTFEDYEQLALAATRSVARVKCNVPTARSSRLPPGTVEILIVPAVADSLRAGDLSKLHVDATLAQVVEDYLDSYRLLTTVLSVQEPRYMGVQVRAEIVPDDYSQPEQVMARVTEALDGFLSPLPMDDQAEQRDELMGADWAGWPFGRDLFVAEILSMIQRVPGVKHVLDVQLGWRAIVPNKEPSPVEDGDASVAKSPLRTVDGRVLRVPADTLLCSLSHEIVLAELDD